MIFFFSDVCSLGLEPQMSWPRLDLDTLKVDNISVSVSVVSVATLGGGSVIETGNSPKAP